MEKKLLIPYETLPERYSLHRLLDDWLDVTEKNSFIDGRKSAIDELMPHTVQFKKVAKAMKKTNNK